MLKKPSGFAVQIQQTQTYFLLPRLRMHVLCKVTQTNSLYIWNAIWVQEAQFYVGHGFN